VNDFIRYAVIGYIVGIAIAALVSLFLVLAAA
jgi:hypothetical protein